MIGGSDLIALILAGTVQSELSFHVLHPFFCNPQQGVLRTDPVPEAGEDAAATIDTTDTLSQEEQEELRRELAKVKGHSSRNFPRCP